MELPLKAVYSFIYTTAYSEISAGSFWCCSFAVSQTSDAVSAFKATVCDMNTLATYHLGPVFPQQINLPLI